MAGGVAGLCLFWSGGGRVLAGIHREKCRVSVLLHLQIRLFVGLSTRQQRWPTLTPIQPTNAQVCTHILKHTYAYAYAYAQQTQHTPCQW